MTIALEGIKEVIEAVKVILDRDLYICFYSNSISYNMPEEPTEFGSTMNLIFNKDEPINEAHALAVKKIIETNHTKSILEINTAHRVIIEALANSLRSNNIIKQLTINKNLGKEEIDILSEALKDNQEISLELHFSNDNENINSSVIAQAIENIPILKYLHADLESFSSSEVTNILLNLANNHTLEHVIIQLPTLDDEIISPLVHVIKMNRNLPSAAFLFQASNEKLDKIVINALEDNIGLMDFAFNFSSDNNYSIAQTSLKRNIEIGKTGVRAAYEKAKSIIYKEKEENTDNASFAKVSNLTSKDIYLLLQNKDWVQILSKYDTITPLHILHLETYTIENYFRIKEISKEINLGETFNNLPLEIIHKIFKDYLIYNIKEDIEEAKEKEATDLLGSIQFLFNLNEDNQISGESTSQISTHETTELIGNNSDCYLEAQ